MRTLSFKNILVNDGDMVSPFTEFITQSKKQTVGKQCVLCFDGMSQNTTATHKRNKQPRHAGQQGRVYGDEYYLNLGLRLNMLSGEEEERK